MDDATRELVTVERTALADELSRLALPFAYACTFDVGSPEFKGAMSYVARRLAEAVAHINEIGVLLGTIDPDDPANKVLSKARADYDKLRPGG